MSTAIQIEGVSKRYRLGLLGHGALYRDLQSWWARRRGKEDPNVPVHMVSKLKGAFGGPVWALKDVSQAVEVGEVIGIIGQNGAGKSTLLKILSRITAPTTGQVRIRGRVASLLEVGTGFHYELTGRENVFLNGAILGMTRAEVSKKFDEIVDFSGVEKYIDTPVKRYSSGMHLRLAFAVAAHLEPEILIVDEVLAVGDAEFQKKCLGKMQDQARSGRTVMFVSHNMGSIRLLCNRCWWFHQGFLRQVGEVNPVVDEYLECSGYAGANCSQIEFPEDATLPSQVRAAKLVDEKGWPTEAFSCDDAVIIELVYEVRVQLKGLYAYMLVTKSDGTNVMLSYSHDIRPDPLASLSVGKHRIRIAIPPRILGHGRYSVEFCTASKAWGAVNVDSRPTILSFSLEDLNTRSGNNRIGYLSTLLDWDVSSESGESKCARSN